MWVNQFWSLLYSLLREFFLPPPIPVIMVLLRKLNPLISIPAFRILHPWFHSGARGLSTDSKVRRRRAVCKPHKKTPCQSVERLRVLINIFAAIRLYDPKCQCFIAVMFRFGIFIMVFDCFSSYRR
jgi:hypothetical protein